MKKILSIFSISAILGSGTIISGGGIACNTFNKGKFDLNSLIVKNININTYEEKKTKTKLLAINCSLAYLNAKKQIIKQYNSFFWKHKKNSIKWFCAWY